MLETRAEQARLFNDPEGDHKVLVASDAIGMGLNLYIISYIRNIRRIIFEATSKYNGVENVDLSVSQMKQIAGRAGRFGTKWENGIVTTLDDSKLNFLKRGLAATSPFLKVL